MRHKECLSQRMFVRKKGSTTHKFLVVAKTPESILRVRMMYAFERAVVLLRLMAAALLNRNT